MLTLAQWILRLTKGYIKYTGKKPDGLASLKIKMEAAQKVKDQSKVVKGDFNPNEEWWKPRPKKASGGIARVGFGKGKLVTGFFELIERLFKEQMKKLIQIGSGQYSVPRH